MASVRKGHRQPPKSHKKEDRGIKRKRDQDAVEALQKKVDELDVKATDFNKFTELPLCEATASGLRQSHFQTLTDVQKEAIPVALKGQDILCAAKTGSGKTLAFLIPVLEKLHRAQWTEYDGLGALIISPTRELAVQIFEVLRKIGRNHMFSAGLVIGGKSMKEEADRLGRMNILVCTPGRMLQHLDQTPELDVTNLQMLVLDEADRIMDMGFAHAVDALVEHLPKDRQTLLFSATQSKKVSDIARLSLNEPQYISVHEAASASTPTNLQQHWIEVPLAEKLDTLYGFIRANVKSKMIVFLSSTKQVRFVYEALKRLQPGIPLLHLIGRQKQEARLAVTKRFRAAKYSCLFATDVVARGVDFPAVDWVVQVDVPEDVDTYVHRVGRTARYESQGRALLFVDPSEEKGIMKKLEHKKVPIQKTNVREKKKKSIANQLQDLCFKNPDIKYLAQKAFISYVRSVQMQKDKDTFDLEKLDLDAFATNMGLSGTPHIKFKKGDDIKTLKNAPRTGLSSGSESEDSDDEEGVRRKKTVAAPIKTKYDKMAERKNQDVLSSHYQNLVEVDGDNSDQEFFSVKRVLRGDELDGAAKKADGKEDDMPKTVDLGGRELVIDSKRREKLLKSKKKLANLRGAGSKLVFDEDGNAHELYELQNEEDFKREGPADKIREAFVEEHGAMARERDAEDKLVAKQKRREKREKRKAREREEELGIKAPAREARLPDAEGEDDDAEDPLEFLRSLPTAGKQSDSEGGDGQEDEPPKKKAKKWFQDDSDDEREKKRKKKNIIEMDHEPETLEDYEALAQGLLDT